MNTAPHRHSVLFLSATSMALAAISTGVAWVLVELINVITNVAFYGRLSAAPSSPAGNQLGWAVLAIPPVGGILIGLMARYGSRAIRGHGIPEAMEQILLNRSRIPA